MSYGRADDNDTEDGDDKARESSLAHAEHALFMDHPLPTWLCDDCLTILASNRAADELVGGPSGRMTGHPFSELAPALESSRLHDEVLASIESGSALPPCLLRCKEGHDLWARLHPVQLSWNEHPAHFAIIAVDGAGLRETVAGKAVDTERVNRVLARLPRRQRQVLELALNGYITKQIAAELNLSERTVEGYQRNLRQQLGFRNAQQMLSAMSGLAKLPSLSNGMPTKSG